jgi:hypothetical protein
MMDDDGAFASSRGSANTAAITISPQDVLSQPTKIFFVLPFQGVAGCTKTECKESSRVRIGNAMPAVLRSSKRYSSMLASPTLISEAIQPSFQGCVRPSSNGIPFDRASPPASNNSPHVSA